MNRKIVFFSVAGVLLLVFAVAAVLYKNHKVGEQTVAVSGNQKALLRAGAPVKGNKDAKVTIVEFFDP
ncbi:MAG TPA: hypothetical protein HPQ00_14950, partial [Magnetococcales bacterium]|nr:hypothetical protein [Magnetococcales bacterium]